MGWSDVVFELAHLTINALPQQVCPQPFSPYRHTSKARSQKPTPRPRGLTTFSACLMLKRAWREVFRIVRGAVTVKWMEIGITASTPPAVQWPACRAIDTVQYLFVCLFVILWGQAVILICPSSFIGSLDMLYDFSHHLYLCERPERIQ